MVNKSFKSLVIVLVSAFVFSSQAGDMSEAAIKERIKPVAQVKVAGAVEVSADAGPRSGADVYQTSCFACHGTGAMNAPKAGDAAAWGPRMEQGIDVMLGHAINGYNAMPPKGTCGNCSDDDIKAAIEHMIDGL
ncbi:cytochrome c5 family protein [Alteromonadaceae bacterium BrNp21-10]|nr:cytochrome c5 family protein [Alteromonadaceae bacterium BrNp21-10]